MSINLIQPEMGDEEEITDLFGTQIDKALPKLKKGKILKFETATLEITKIDRSRKRIWAKHTRLMSLDEAHEILQKRGK